jgi:hypothetical protein
LITLSIGINDVGLQLPDDAFAVNLEEIVVQLPLIEPLLREEARP